MSNPTDQSRRNPVVDPKTGQYAYKPPVSDGTYHFGSPKTAGSTNATYKQPASSYTPKKPPKKKSPKPIWIVVGIIFFFIFGLPVIGGIVIGIEGAINSKKLEAEREQVYVEAPSDEDMQQLQAADDHIALMESFYRVDGYVPADDVDTCVNDVANYAASLVEDGILVDYSNDGSSVWMIDKYGLQTIYIPSQEDTLAFNTNEYYSITTIEPHEGTFGESGERYHDKNEEAATVFDDISEQWLYTADLNTYEVTPEIVKTFGENQIILWLGHGAWVPGSGPSLVTGEFFDAQRYSYDKEYRSMFGSGQWARTGGDESRIIITPEYISANMGSLKNSVVFLGACKSSESVELVSAFLKKGAIAVVGNSDTIRLSYYTLMMRSMVQTLCTRDASGQYNTFATALNAARQEYGADDSVRCGGEGARVEIFGQDVENLRITDVMAEAPTEPEEVPQTQPAAVDVHQLLANYASQFGYLNGTTGYTGYYTKTQYRNVYSYGLPDSPVAYTIADFDQDNVEELLIVDSNSDNTIKLEMYEVYGESVACAAEMDLPVPIAGSAENSTTEYFYFYRDGRLQICVSEFSLADRVASGTILRCSGAIYDGSTFYYQGLAEVVGTADESDPFVSDMAAMGINVNIYDMLSGYKLATDYLSRCTVFCTARSMCTIMDGEWMTYQDVWFGDDSLTYLEISYIGFKRDLLSA